MLHKLNHQKIKGAVVGCVLVFSFQNCAKQSSQSGDFSSSSLTEINQDYETHPGGSVTPTVPVGNGPSVTDTSPEGAYNLLMDRKMVYSLFQDILGPSSPQMGTMGKLKFDRGVMGGPCSVYDNFKSDRTAFNRDVEADTCGNSGSGSNLGSRVEPSANELQEAMINDICVDAASNNQVLTYVFAQLKENANVSVPANTDENVLKLISLFYRNKPMASAGLIESMRTVVGTPATNDGWKKAFLTTCTSVHWQTL